MGHTRLGTGLPQKRRWNEVIGLIGAGGSTAAVAAATTDAIDERFQRAADDATLRHTFWLLTQLPDAARSGDFAAALRDLDVRVTRSPSTIELATAVAEAIDRFSRSERGPSGAGELARLAAVETLSRTLVQRTSSLFPTTAGEVRSAVASLGTEVQFATLSRHFFARFTDRYLAYIVERELPLHVGAGKRFSSLSDARAFNDALAEHCFQAAKIVEKFAGAWYSKARHEQQLNEERTGRFLGYAFEKLRSELRVRAG